MTETRKPAKKNLDPIQRAGHLLLASFKHSRGNPGLQKSIFQFVALYHGSKFTSEAVQQARPMVVEAAGKYMYESGQHVAVRIQRHTSSVLGLIEQTVEEQAGSFRAQLDHWAPRSNGLDLTEAAANVVGLDARWIPHLRDTYDGGRFSGQRAPYRSNLVHHGLLARSTGMEEIDDFYTRISERLLAVWQRPEQAPHNIMPHTYQAIAAHLSYNPDDAQPLMGALTK